MARIKIEDLPQEMSGEELEQVTGGILIGLNQGPYSYSYKPQSAAQLYFGAYNINNMKLPDVTQGGECRY